MKKITVLLTGFSILFAIFNGCVHKPEDGLMPPPPPGNGNGNNPPPPTGGQQTCSPDTVYFQNNVLPLLVSSCAKIGCHDANTHQDGVQLTSYATIMNTADVDPGDPDGSELYQVLNETDPDDRMPQPPNPPLTAAEKAIIYNWILQGAQNNSCDDCDTTNDTWSGAVQPLINTNCRGCHNPTFLSAGVDLSNYDNVRTLALNGTLIGVIDHLPGFPQMPRGAPKLDDCKITQVRNWINDGAPNN